MGETLSVSVSDGIGTKDVGPGGTGKPVQKKQDGGPPPTTPQALKQSIIAILFDGIALFARGPSRAFLTYLQPA